MADQLKNEPIAPPTSVYHELEISLVWGDNNPELFVEAVKKFQEVYPASRYNHTVDLSRRGFMTLGARLL